MDILKVIGKIGAIAAGGAALILAGKTGFGSDLFNNKEDGVDTDDLTNPEVPEEASEAVEEEVQEEEEEEVPE